MRLKSLPVETLNELSSSVSHEANRIYVPSIKYVWKTDIENGVSALKLTYFESPDRTRWTYEQISTPVPRESKLNYLPHGVSRDAAPCEAGLMIMSSLAPYFRYPLKLSYSLIRFHILVEITGAMEYSHIITNDGCKIAFQTSQPLDPLFAEREHDTLTLLIHGFSGSSLYFQRNFDELSASSWVIAIDLRGHGNSGRPKGGYHVARLATDLKDIISHVKNVVPGIKVVPVGCSIGAAILWTYVELFNDDDFAGMVFVDQAPLQDRSAFDSWDDTKAHRGCFDERSMLGAQEAWTRDPENAFKGLVGDCLGYRYQPLPGDDTSEERGASDEEFFTSQSRRCNTLWLARLLADHTRYDHREACEQIKVPVLVMAGRRTGCFPLDGMKETVRRVEMGQKTRNDGVQPKWSVFESGHWLFWEEPARFNEEIKQFVSSVADATTQDKSNR